MVVDFFRMYLMFRPMDGFVSSRWASQLQERYEDSIPGFTWIYLDLPGFTQQKWGTISHVELGKATIMVPDMPAFGTLHGPYIANIKPEKNNFFLQLRFDHVFH